MPSDVPSLRNAAALLVGVGHYSHESIARLRYSAVDARSLAKLMVSPEVCAIPANRVKLLVDGKANRESMVRHFSRWLPQQAHGADLVFVYFAGHGVADAESDAEGYLLPIDADPNDVATTGIAMSEVVGWLDQIDARAIVVCLDCCHAGGILAQEGLSLRTLRDLRISPTAMQNLGGKGRFLIASCDRDQKSLEADELGHGLFTYHLLRGLAGAADKDGDGLVGVAELFAYVSTAVSREAKQKYHIEQTPWTRATYSEEVIVSTVRKRGSKKRKDSSTVNEAPTQPLPADEAERVAQLRQIRKGRQINQLALVFGSLAHRSEQIRMVAREALSAFDWDEVIDQCQKWCDDSEAMGAILDGINALESHERLVKLLDRLAGQLTGPLRDRANWLLERKKLARDMAAVAKIFRDKHSPYELIRVLGPGTYTGAYLARMETTGLEVVVRVLRSEFIAHPQIRSQFVELGRKAVRLVHQNLALTREVRVFTDPDVYYTVRDYISGVTLREVLESGRRFEPLQICKILRQIGEALVPLHREGIVHAGIKPSNLFLTRDNTLIVGDPSLALPTTGLDLPRLVYDYRYTPPELFGNGSLSVAADFYSLGCVAYELVHGQPPFVRESPWQLIACHERDAIPHLQQGTPAEQKFHTFLERLLAKKPSERFGDLTAFLFALADVEQAQRQISVLAEPSEPKAETSGHLTLGEGIISPAYAAYVDSVRLMREQSLMEFEGRDSIVPLSHMGGPSVETVYPDREVINTNLEPKIPGYDVIRLLGQGGMGKVYLARQQVLDRMVAIKTIRTRSNEQSLARFLQEGRVIARLQHPNILSIHDMGHVEGQPYLVLEYCDGSSLAARMNEAPLSIEEAVSLVATLADAVAYAHSQQIIHRDLKPGNVLFTGEGVPKITDFGLARLAAQEAGITAVGMIMGTPAYMSPEQARGNPRELGPASDIWSLGAMLYELLTGVVPFRAPSMMEIVVRVMNAEPESLRRFRPEISRELERIVQQCLAKNPSERYSSAQDLAHALRNSAQGRSSGSRWWWPFQ
jgi:serine/threonine protein kinase